MIIAQTVEYEDAAIAEIAEGIKAVALNRIMRWAYDASEQAILPKFLDCCK